MGETPTNDKEVRRGLTTDPRRVGVPVAPVRGRLVVRGPPGDRRAELLLQPARRDHRDARREAPGDRRVLRSPRAVDADPEHQAAARHLPGCRPRGRLHQARGSLARRTRPRRPPPHEGRRRGDGDRPSRHVAVGSFEHEIVDELAPLPGELVLDKNASSPFNGTGIDQLLRNLGVETLVLVGVATDMCVETTGRDAADRGYNVIVAEDATATYLSPAGRSCTESASDVAEGRCTQNRKARRLRSRLAELRKSSLQAPALFSA